MPPPNGGPPPMSPEQMEKMSAFLELMANGLASIWTRDGKMQAFADVVCERMQQFNFQLPKQPGAAPRVSPSVPCMVNRYSRKGRSKVEQTTVAELLAEIADNQQDILDRQDTMISLFEEMLRPSLARLKQPRRRTKDGGG